MGSGAEAPKLGDILHKLAEANKENARLRADIDARIALTHDHLDKLNLRERERDEARAKLAKVVEAWGALQDSLMLAREYERAASPTEREALRTLDSLAAARGE